MDCTKLLALAFIAGFHSASALVCQGQNRKMSYGRAWLETQRVLPSIEARGVKIKFCEQEPIYVQLYETSNEPGFRYRLVWQELIQPGAIEEKSFKLARPITIKDSYRVGVYMPNSEATYLPVSKLSTMQIQLSASDHFDVFDLKSIYSFRDLLEPGQFEIDFCGAECDEDEVIKSRPSTLPPVEYQCKPDQTDLFSGVSGTLLQNGRHLATGVAKALKTFFCGDATVTIQLFRPSDDDLNAYTLVWEKDIRSQSRHGERTQISFSRDEYVYIDESYRLGIKASSSDSPMPIPFSFHQTASTVRSRSPADVSLCSTVQFDDLGYPRDFNIEFCSNPDCADSDTSRVDREAVETPCSGGDSSAENAEEGDTHKTTTTPENIITNRRPTKGRQTPPRYANGPTTRPTGSDPKVDESKSKPGSATSIWHTTSIIALLVISAFFVFLQQ